MGFLAPALLALGALAAVPLLVHLLRRRVGRIVDFPAVRYLTRMEQEHSRELKLRHRLLLLLRMLAVLALALAAARPIARIAGLGHAPLAVAVVIDNSMSSGAVTGGRSALEGERDEARALLAALSPDDRAWLVTADGRVTGGQRDALLSAVDGITPLGARGNLPAAIRRAAALTASGAPRAPVVTLLSDGQANALRSARAATGTVSGSADSAIAMASVPLVALVTPRAVANRAVVAATVDPTRWTPSGAVIFSVASNDSAAWRIVLEGKTVARGVAPPGSIQNPSAMTQRISSTGTGWLRGSVELDADELRADDMRTFAVRVAAPPSVAVRAEAGPFLSTGLTTLVEEKRLARAPEGSSGAVTVSTADAPNLRTPVLLTAPSDPIRVGEANRTLARLGIPWRFGAIARDLVVTRPLAGVGGGPADSLAPDDAKRASGALLDVPVRLRYPLVPSPGTAVNVITDTLAMAGGAAWAVSGPDYILIASPLEPDATDLPIRAGFVPWLLDALSRRLGSDGRVLTAVPGQVLDGINGMTALEHPDGSLTPLAGDRITVPNLSGTYFLRRQDTRAGALVVNAEPEESDLTMVADSGAALLSAVSGRSIHVERDAASWRRRIFESAAGRSLLWPLLVIALIALLLESWLARDRFRMH